MLLLPSTVRCDLVPTVLVFAWGLGLYLAALVPSGVARLGGVLVVPALVLGVLLLVRRPNLRRTGGSWHVPSGPVAVVPAATPALLAAVALAAALAGVAVGLPTHRAKAAPVVADALIRAPRVLPLKPKQCATGRLTEARGIEGQAGYSVRLCGPGLRAGSLLRLTGRLRPSIRRADRSFLGQPMGALVGTFRWRKTCLADRVPSKASLPRASEQTTCVIVQRDQLWEALHHVRSAVVRGVKRSLSVRAAGWVMALALGDRSGLPEGDRHALSASGLAHLLAVSGLHVAMACGFVRLAFSAFWRLVLSWGLSWLGWCRALSWALGLSAPALGALCTALGVVPLVVLMGASPSACRAGTMAAVYFAIQALGHRPQPMSSLFASFFALSLVSPTTVQTPAFVLSALATYVLLDSLSCAALDNRATKLLALPTPWWRRWCRRVADLSGLQLRLMAVTSPVLLAMHLPIAPSALLANAVLAPLATALLLPVAMLSAVGAYVSVEGWIPTAWLSLADSVLSALIDWLVLAARAIARALPPVFTEGAGWGACCMAAAAVAIAWRQRATIRGWAAVLGIGAGFMGYAGEPALALDPTALRLTMWDVGQGDAILIEMPNGKRALIDGGPSGFGRRPAPLLHYLEQQRIGSLDVVVLTHAHPDHYGGLAALIGRVQIKELWMSAQPLVEWDSGSALRLLRNLRSASERVRGPSELCQRPLRFGKAELQLLAPCPAFDPTKGFNDNSLILRLKHGRRTALLMGDAEAEAEADLLERSPQLGAEVLKVGHHGSSTSTSRRILKATQPCVALISAGWANRYGHPHGRVIDRLLRRGIVTWVTADDGSATLHASRDGWFLSHHDGVTRVAPCHGRAPSP